MTVASMTGFARAAGQRGGWSWAWELKSVNGKSLDIRLRLPPGHDRLEMPVREAAAKRFRRGNVTIVLTLARHEGEMPFRVNRELLERLLTLQSEFEGRVAPELPRFEALLAVRGVIEPVAETEAETELEARDLALVESLGEALEALAAARAEEGARLAAVLRDQLGGIEDLCDEAAAAESARPETIRERLREQVEALLQASPALPEDRLAQEAAILAAKADIREELDRLSAHIDAARDLVGEGGAIGRRLDFLCQELNRETNTLCAKSGDAALTRVGLALKAAIEQFREQVQNVE